MHTVVDIAKARREIVGVRKQLMALRSTVHHVEDHIAYLEGALS